MIVVHSFEIFPFSFCFGWKIEGFFGYSRHVQGICDDVAKIMKHMHGLDFNPLTDIAICYGQSEAFAATMFASMFSYLRWFIMWDSYVLYGVFARLVYNYLIVLLDSNRQRRWRYFFGLVSLLKSVWNSMEVCVIKIIVHTAQTAPMMLEPLRDVFWIMFRIVQLFVIMISFPS